MEIQARAEEAVRRTVTPSGNGAHVTVPGDWHGCDVLVIRLNASTPRPKKETPAP